MNTKEIPMLEFERTLAQTISSLAPGCSITVNYADDNLICLSHGKKLFESKNVDGANALDIQLYLVSHSFHINDCHMNPYTYKAVFQKAHEQTTKVIRKLRNY